LKPFHCAIIGCGRIGCEFDDNKRLKKRTHATGYITNPKTKLVALCDVDNKKLKKYGKKYSISSLYIDSKKMFNEKKLDCVSICTFADSHLRLVQEAVSNGVKCIFIEKPISDSLSSTKKIIELCRKNKVILAVDHQRRFEPFYHSIKNFINKKLGKVDFVNVFYGAGIANTGSHVFDLLRFFFGEVLQVKGEFSEIKSPNNKDLNLDVFLKFEKGPIAFLKALDLRNYGICEFNIFGTNGRIILDILSNKVTYLKPSSNYFDYVRLSPTEFSLTEDQVSGTILGIKNMIGCISTGKEPLCTGYDGYKSLELVIASILSAKERKKVYLPLKNNSYKISSK